MATKKDKPEDDGEADTEAEPESEVFESTWTLTSVQKALLPNLWQRMIIARQHMQYIKKTRQGGLKFATVNHDEVTVAAREALDKANVLAIPNVLMHDKTGNTTICEVAVEFVNPDNPEERYSVTMFGESNDNQDKGPGGAISYTIKFCLLKGLMGETGEKDPDMQDVDTRHVGSEPTESDKESAERDDWMGAIKHAIEKHDLDKDYVWAQMKQRAKDAMPSIEELSHFAKHIDEHPQQWRSEQAGGE